VDLDRFQGHKQIFYDLNWKRLPFTIGFPQGERDIQRPDVFDKMLSAARELARGFDFVRVDLYEENGVVIFGEMTFYPGNGLCVFNPRSYDKVIGGYLYLNTH
jgi:hypothetical protein